MVPPRNQYYAMRVVLGGEQRERWQTIFLYMLGQNLMTLRTIRFWRWITYLRMTKQAFSKESKLVLFLNMVGWLLIATRDSAKGSMKIQAIDQVPALLYQTPRAVLNMAQLMQVIWRVLLVLHACVNICMHTFKILEEMPSPWLMQTPNHCFFLIVFLEMGQAPSAKLKSYFSREYDFLEN